MTVEISLTVVLSIVALSLSAYSITVAKRRNETIDAKDLTKQLATLDAKMETIAGAVLGKPTLSEKVTAHETKITEIERRITTLEKSK